MLPYGSARCDSGRRCLLGFRRVFFGAVGVQHRAVFFHSVPTKYISIRPVYNDLYPEIPEGSHKHLRSPRKVSFGILSIV
jgi:hypothetical protein